MSSFPWGQLTLILLALDILFTVLFLLRKRILKRFIRRALDNGNNRGVAALLHFAEKERLIRPAEYRAWLKEFDLEEFG
jgi:hypothetical protein